MHNQLFTLLRVRWLDTAGQAVFKRELWLVVVGARRHELTLIESQQAYRQRYDLENIFRRLKGRRLSLTPLYLHRDDHALGLVRLLTLAARLLAVAEYRLRG